MISRKKVLTLAITLLIVHSVFGAHYYVSKTGNDDQTGLNWEQSFATITKSLENTVPEDQIWVAKGVYQEETTLTIPEGISVYGGFSGSEMSLDQQKEEKYLTIIDGQSRFLCVHNYGTIDGFSVTNGYVEDGDGVINTSGLQNEITGLVNQCQVYRNSTNDRYAGIYNSGTVTNSAIHSNLGRGIYNSESAIFEQCSIFNNQATGSAGGYNKGVINACRIYKNHANQYRCGGIYNNGTLLNSLIYKNTAESAHGGVINSGQVINCTIYGNTAETSGGIANSTDALIQNSIIWGNTDENGNNSNISWDGPIIHSCYPEAETVNGNIHADPLFQYTENDVTTLDFHLRPGSRCIDSGQAENAPEKDFDGIARPAGSGIDMGAYECDTNELRALFYITDTNPSAGSSVYFYDYSYGSPQNWAWDFDNDGIVDSTEQNPTWVYTEGGTYSVKLTVSSGSTQSSFTKEKAIHIQQIWHVKKDGSDFADGTSWESSFQTIQKALSHAKNSDQIWVASGIYKEGETLNIPQNISLYGGFAGNETYLEQQAPEKNPTIIDGEASILCIRNEGRIDGAMITNGKVYIQHNGYSIGGIENKSSGIVNRCKIYGNTFGLQNSGTVSNSEIYYNLGTIITNGPTGFIESCKIHRNRGTIMNSGGVFNACRLSKNTKSSSFSYLSYQEWGAVNSGTLTNCIIDNNDWYTRNGGEIINCTIIRNRGESTGGVANSYEGSVKNSILWHNTDENGNTANVSTDGVVHYSCYEEADGTNANISDDPLFLYLGEDPLAFDLHLQPGSPCLDKGTAYEAPLTDYEGKSRPIFLPEMGVYEYYPNTLKALFSMDQTHGEPGTEIQFYDLSYDEPTSWEWDFDNDGIIDSTEQNPTWTYNLRGTYTVKLTVSNEHDEDSLVKESVITIHQIWYVKTDGSDIADGTSWDSSFQTIKKALSSSQQGDQIWIAEGIYQEETTLTIPESVSVYGGFAGTETNLDERDLSTNKTIIDGQGQYKCVTNYGKLDNIILTNGKEANNDAEGIGNYGTFYQCCLTENSGAIYNYENGVLDQCKVYRNTYYFQNDGTIRESSIYENFYEYLSGPEDFLINTGAIEQCEIYQNRTIYGSTIANSGTISSCRIHSNISYSYSDAIISNYGIIENSAVYDCSSCGISNHKTVLNCTVYGNRDYNQVAGIENRTNAKVYNSIIRNNIDTYRNTESNIDDSRDVFTSCFAESTGENGNIATSPQFIDPDQWNFHLHNNSPCMDTGTLYDENTSEADLDGNSRNQGERIDMGCYERSDSVTALFYSDKTAADSAESIQFYDISYGTPSSWAWDFDNDGNIDSTDQNPTWSYALSGDYSVSLTISDGTNTNTKSKENLIHIAERWYVSPYGSDTNSGKSWEFPFRSVSRATMGSKTKDQIWVEAGIYSSTQSLGISQGVQLYGGFDGTESNLNRLNLNDNTKTIIAGSSGTTILNFGEINGISSTGRGYTGIMNFENGIIDNCNVYENSGSESFGGGVWNHGIIRNSQVHHNNGGTSEGYSAGGIYNYGTVDCCKVFSNECYHYGGGLYNRGTVKNSLVYNNTAKPDPDYYENPWPSSGGGLFNEGNVMNCTVFGNKASVYGGVCNPGTLTNSIIWGNTTMDGATYDIYSESEGISNCCYSEATAENGNISDDPLFVNTQGEIELWDLHLKAGSPCIDSGTSDNAPTTDIEGTVRPQGDGFDMGAYESQYSKTQVETSEWRLYQ